MPPEDEAAVLRRRIAVMREAMAAGVPHATIRTLAERGDIDALQREAAARKGQRDALWDAWCARRSPCPRCGAAGVHLLYGIPGPLGARAAGSGQVVLGGAAEGELRAWHCNRCGSEWGDPADDPVPLRPPS